MANRGLKSRRRGVGGLQITIYQPGQSIKINHAGESMELIFMGKNGTNEYCFNLVAPRSFEVDYSRKELRRNFESNRVQKKDQKDE